MEIKPKSEINTKKTMKRFGIMFVCIIATAVALVCSLTRLYAQNIVQNGDFTSGFADWSGIGAIAGTGGIAPGSGKVALGYDMYQDLGTSPGQQYSLSSYLAADLWSGPSTDIAVSLNNQVVTSITTPPYTYNGGIGRYVQMRWQQVSFVFLAFSDTTRLEFTDTDGVGFGLNSVSVIAVPEPNVISIASVILVCGFIPGVRYSHK
jgi:hypothetical protein